MSARLKRVSGDDGSLMLAILASVIVLGLVLVMTATAIAGQQTVRHDRDFAVSLQAADAGVNRAIFKLTASRTAVSPQSGSGAFGNSSYTWTATRITPREWVVASEGTSGKSTRRVVANVEEDRRFFASAFAEFGVGFNGNNTADSYSSVAGQLRTPGPGRYGLVGSNGNVTFLGNSTVIDGVQLWNWAADSSGARCTGNAAIGLQPSLSACSAAAAVTPANDIPYQQRINEKRVFSPTRDELLERMAACGSPPYPDLTIVSNPESVLAPYTGATRTTGPVRAVAPQNGRPGYYCYNNVIIKRDTTLETGTTRDNPVVLYVAGNVSVEGNGRRVNCPTCVSNKDSSPDAAALQIYNAGASSTLSTSPQAKISFAWYGPRTTCGGGAGNEIYGAIICGNIDNVGGWGFHYDEALDRLGNAQYRILRYQER